MSSGITMRADSREHVEAWLEFERLFDEIAGIGDELGNMVYTQELIDLHGLPQDVLGKTVEEVGLPPALADGTLEQLRELQEKLETVAVPSPEAIRDYLLRRLNDRVDQLHERVAKIEAMT
jgi:hypothetical protein